ncbi:hypothetical protein BDV96DRAFT_639013 [Lophiotrema nucula]|uniref:U1-type domain-containing protein n=1 Tax=Lophiotrema nucula TaxID=690887 RepID=A0A6A5ZU61_9PLEO|nr:hypothetical protein BDV96DRAFT_639013 [Lophiotrema nucula]
MAPSHTCEICKRRIPPSNWDSHKASKKHQRLEAAQQPKQCDICGRSIEFKDWDAHCRSKKHRKLEDVRRRQQAPTPQLAAAQETQEEQAQQADKQSERGDSGFESDDDDMPPTESSYKTMKEQVLTNAFALYGKRHPHSSQYDVIVTRTYSLEKYKTTHRAALIVYLEPGSKEVWKLLKKSRPNATPYDAVDQLDIWLRDELDDAINKMRPGDVYKAKEHKGSNRVANDSADKMDIDAPASRKQSTLPSKNQRVAKTDKQASSTTQQPLKRQIHFTRNSIIATAGEPVTNIPAITTTHDTPSLANADLANSNPEKSKQNTDKSKPLNATPPSSNPHNQFIRPPGFRPPKYLGTLPLIPTRPPDNLSASIRPTPLAYRRVPQPQLPLKSISGPLLSSSVRLSQHPYFQSSNTPQTLSSAPPLPQERRDSLATDPPASSTSSIISTATSDTVVPESHRQALSNHAVSVEDVFKRKRDEKADVALDLRKPEEKRFKGGDGLEKAVTRTHGTGEVQSSEDAEQDEEDKSLEKSMTLPNGSSAGVNNEGEDANWIRKLTQSDDAGNVSEGTRTFTFEKEIEKRSEPDDAEGKEDGGQGSSLFGDPTGGGGEGGFSGRVFGRSFG